MMLKHINVLIITIIRFKKYCKKL